MRRLAAVLLVVCVGVAWSPSAQACGQQTHTWISLEAARLLPEGRLKDLLSSDQGERYLINGSMFPDGGYAISHPYGEAAHWAPFHIGYADWVRANHPDPYASDEGRLHLAFLMGVVSHGLADEFYDATFFAASRVHDAVDGVPDHHNNFDTASDVLFAAASGQRLEPDASLPMEAILHVYSQVLRLDVSADQIERGQNLLRTAAWIVAISADDPSEVVDSERQYPWAAEHINDRSVSGSPPVIAEAVASYWKGLEKRVLEPGQPDDSPLAYQWPRPGEPLAARAKADPASRIALMLSRAVGESDQLSELGTLADFEDGDIEHTSWFFYRDHSHMVVAEPATEWPETERVHYRLPEGLESYDGTRLEAPADVTFRTKPLPEPEPPAQGCSCDGLGSSVFGLLALAGLRRRQRLKNFLSKTGDALGSS